jgi:hypothetical protein
VAALGVERGGFRVGIKRERNVLGGESAGKDGERGVHARIVTDGKVEVKQKAKIFLSPITLGGVQAVHYYPERSGGFFVLGPSGLG